MAPLGGREEPAGSQAILLVFDRVQRVFLQEICRIECLRVLLFGEHLCGDVGFLSHWMLEYYLGTLGCTNGFVCSDKGKV